MKDIEIIWTRIKQNEFEVFKQIRGNEFNYSVVGNSIKPNRTNRLISKTDFNKALKLVPLSDTKDIQNLQGPSYIFAILMDKRIKKDDW